MPDSQRAKAPPRSEIEPQLSRREAGKAERRRRIIEAARCIIRETGDAGLSMRALAARAGVSLATPYNLFGSKRAIILALLGDVREFRERFRAVKTVDPLERIFLAVDMSTGFYVEDPVFYRTLWASMFDTSDEVRAEIENPKAAAFWMSLLKGADAAGVLIKEIDRELIQRQFTHVFRSVMLDWVVGELPSEALAPNIRLGFAMVLGGVAAPEWRGPLMARMLESQRRLHELARETSPGAETQGEARQA